MNFIDTIHITESYHYNKCNAEVIHDTLIKHHIVTDLPKVLGIGTGDLFPAIIGGILSGLVAVLAAYWTVKWTHKSELERMEMQSKKDKRKDQLERFTKLYDEIRDKSLELVTSTELTMPEYMRQSMRLNHLIADYLNGINKPERWKEVYDTLSDTLDHVGKNDIIVKHHDLMGLISSIGDEALKDDFKRKSN